MTNKQAFMLSAIVDKLDLEIKNPKASKEEVGANLMLQLVRKAHLAQNEILQLVASVESCTVQEAETMDFTETIQKLVRDPNLFDFFKSAVKSDTQG